LVLVTFKSKFETQYCKKLLATASSKFNARNMSDIWIRSDNQIQSSTIQNQKTSFWATFVLRNHRFAIHSLWCDVKKHQLRKCEHLPYINGAPFHSIFFKHFLLFFYFVKTSLCYIHAWEAGNNIYYSGKKNSWKIFKKPCIVFIISVL
jgi:hypothetical protein